MKVYGASPYDVERVVDEVSRESYAGNLILKSLANQSNSKGPRATFTLRVLDSRAGQRGAVGNPNRTGSGPNGMGRRIGACWHAHWDVIERLLQRFPDARVTSGFRLRGVAVSYTAATFRRTALETAHLNVGGWDRSVTLPQCCGCDHSRYTDAEPDARPELSGRSPVSATVYAGRYAGLEDGDGGGEVWEPTSPPGTGSAWEFQAGGADTTVPYLGGLAPAQPYTRPTPQDTIDRIDAVLAQEAG